MPIGWGAGGLTHGNSKEVSSTGGCIASSCITGWITGLICLDLLGAGMESFSLTEQIDLSNPKNSGALRVLLSFEVVGEAVEEMTEDAATDEALDVLGVSDDRQERPFPAWGFLGFWEDIVLEMLLFAEEIPEAKSAVVGRRRILFSPQYFSLRCFECSAIFSSVVLS